MGEYLVFNYARDMPTVDAGLTDHFDAFFKRRVTIWPGVAISLRHLQEWLKKCRSMNAGEHHSRTDAQISTYEGVIEHFKVNGVDINDETVTSKVLLVRAII